MHLVEGSSAITQLAPSERLCILELRGGLGAVMLRCLRRQGIQISGWNWLVPDGIAMVCKIPHGRSPYSSVVMTQEFQTDEGGAWLYEATPESIKAKRELPALLPEEFLVSATEELRQHREQVADKPTIPPTIIVMNELTPQVDAGCKNILASDNDSKEQGDTVLNCKYPRTDVGDRELNSTFLDSKVRNIYKEKKTVLEFNSSSPCLPEDKEQSIKYRYGVKGDDLKGWYADPDAIPRIAKGIKCSFGKAGDTFQCVLPGHEQHGAAIWRDGEDKPFVYHCWGDSDAGFNGRFYTLPDVRAAQSYGYDKSRKGLEHAVWAIRLLVEANLIDAAEVDAPALPKKVRDSTRAVWQGFLLLLGVRWLHTPEQPVIYNRNFAAAWCPCGTTPRLAGEAITALAGRGYMRKAGNYHRATLWLPGTDELVAERLTSWKAGRC